MYKWVRANLEFDDKEIYPLNGRNSVTIQFLVNPKLTLVGA